MDAKLFIDAEKCVVVFENTNLSELNVKAFDDNGRLQLVFEKTNAGNTKEVLNVEEVAPSEAKPLPVKEEVTEEVVSEGPSVIVIKGGKYDGMDPFKVLDNTDWKEAEKAFVYLAESVKAKKFEAELSKEVGKALNYYLYARFSETDEVAYANKLSEKHCASFFKIFDAAIPPKRKEALAKNANVNDWSEFLVKASIEEKHLAVSEIIKYFKNIKC